MLREIAAGPQNWLHNQAALHPRLLLTEICRGAIVECASHW
jgi:hypothetical protein